jgi:glycine betaine/proline transport system ATP-binding protein
MAQAQGAMGGLAKLSCRNLWKLFGASADDLRKRLQSEGGDIDRVVARLRQDRVIPGVIDASFDVLEGEIFVIMGLSGSGKSTLIRCLSRLVMPEAGQVLFDGRDVLAMSTPDLVALRRGKVGMVFQDFGLMPHMTVLDNVAFPLRINGMPKAERQRRAMAMLEQVGLSDREGSYPSQLSGGQKQRVGIARSLAAEPDLWFLDEPFSALDPLIRRQMQDEFLRLQAALRKTIVFITHDFAEALRLADRIAIMKDGRIEQIDTVARILLHPATPYIEEFTADAPLMQILCARDVMGPPDQGGDGRPVVPGDLALPETIAIAMAGDYPVIDVAGPGGARLGSIGRKALAELLSTVSRRGRRA